MPDAQAMDAGGVALPSGADASEAERFFLSQLPTIERIVAFVCRRNRLPNAEAEDFRSLVQLKLIENDYEVLRRFRGQSTLRTYLTVVIQRRFLDYRVSEWGKWRPSAEARRLGPVAVELERLITRDGLSRDEAIESLVTRAGAPGSRAELLDAYRRLPDRAPRRRVGEENAQDITASVDVEGDAFYRQISPSAERARRALRLAVAELPAQDRVIVRLRFEDGCPIADIAAALRLPQKPLYRRIEGILGGLRRRLEASGLTSPEVRDFLGMLDSGPSLDTGSGG